MKRFLIVTVFLLIASLSIIGCDGKDGVNGITGPSGMDGQDGEFELQGIHNPNNPTVGHGDGPGMPEHAHFDRGTYNDTVVVHCDVGYEWNAPLYTDCVLEGSS